MMTTIAIPAAIKASSFQPEPNGLDLSNEEKTMVLIQGILTEFHPFVRMGGKE